MATDSVYACRYCGESWPSQASLSQQIRGRHMAESQQDRVEETSKGREPHLSRRIWTEELRLAFLEAADRYGWSQHSAIAYVLLPRSDGPTGPKLQNKISQVERGSRGKYDR